MGLATSTKCVQGSKSMSNAKPRFVNPHPAVILKSLILRGGGQLAHRRKSAVSAIFLHTKQQKTFQGTLGTQDLTSKGSKTSHGPSMDPTGPLNWSSKFSNILEPLSGYVYHFYIIHSLAPLAMLELFFGHCGTLSRLRGPSWTFMDPQMDPKMDPPRLISGDPS